MEESNKTLQHVKGVILIFQTSRKFTASEALQMMMSDNEIENSDDVFSKMMKCQLTAES